MSKFEIIWRGNSEDSFKVVDTETKYVVKEFDSQEVGTNIARKAAQRLLIELNGRPMRCENCDGEGRDQIGPSEQICIHCNGRGYQLLLNGAK